MSIVSNRKAFFNYEILDKMEAGIVLQGNEVKSIRNGKVNIAEAFISVRNGEAWVHNMNIQPYDKLSHHLPDPTRQRKLLLHKEQINRLIGKSNEKGLTMIPLSLYFKGPMVKCEVGLGKGKKHGDKRETIKKRELDRELARSTKGVVR